VSDFFDQWELWLDGIEPDEKIDRASQSTRQSKDEPDGARTPSDVLEEPSGG